MIVRIKVTAIKVTHKPCRKVSPDVSARVCVGGAFTQLRFKTGLHKPRRNPSQKPRRKVAETLAETPAETLQKPLAETLAETSTVGI